MENAVSIIYSILSLIPPLEAMDKEHSYEMWSQSGERWSIPGIDGSIVNFHIGDLLLGKFS